MSEKVLMESPDGEESKEVQGGSEELVRLMVAGWHQAKTQPASGPANAPAHAPVTHPPGREA